MAIQKSMTLDNEISLSSAYMVIQKIVITYVGERKAIITICIYKDATAFANGSSEVMELEHVCEGSDFITYFIESVLDNTDKTPLTQAEDWLLTLSYYSGGSKV